MPRLLLCLPALLWLTTACSEIHVKSPSASASLSVSGQAEVRVAPDLAKFTAAVVTEGEEAEATLAANAEQSERLLAALTAAGSNAASLRTTGVRLQPVFSSRPRDADANWRARIIGYQARNQLEVSSTDLSTVGTLLATAVRAGATDIQGLHFSLQDDGAARAEAIRLATERALREARTLAVAAGTEAGPIRELRLDGAYTQAPPMLRSAMMDARAEFSSVPVEAGEVTVTAAVSLTMAID